MATKRWVQVKQVEAVGAGKTAIITPPTNVRYHALALKYGTDTAGGATEANMITELPDIEVYLGGVVQRKFSASELFKINKTKKQATVAGWLPIFFSEPNRRTQIEQEMGAWGMADVGPNGFQIEASIADNSGQAATLKCMALVDDKQEAPVGITKWRRNTITIGATGENEYKLNTQRGDSVQGLYMFEGTAGDIDSFRLEWDGLKIADVLETDVDAMLDTYFKQQYDKVSGVRHIPLDGGAPADVLRTIKYVDGKPQNIQELLLTLNMANAANVTMISELVGTPD